MGDKVAYHPDGVHVIQFLEGPHTYRDNFGKKYLSGTSFVKKYFPQFDSASQATKCSNGKNPKYVGRNPQDILADWEAERVRGSSEGDNAHLYGEAVTAGWLIQNRPAPISDRCTKLFIQIDKAVHHLTVKMGLIFIAAEMIVFSPRLGLSGMIDLLMFDPVLKIIWILDWKQNKKITAYNRWQSGYEPLSHLEQTDINTYTLQLSTYQYLLKNERYFPGLTFKRALIYLNTRRYKLIPLEDYKYEVEEMLTKEGRLL